MNTTSHHFLIELYQVQDASIVLDSIQKVEDILINKAITNGKATYVNHHSFKFDPQGLSCVILLAESHISIHTWPESAYAALDVFTCGSKQQGQLIVDTIVAEFNPGRYLVQYFERGNDVQGFYDEIQIPSELQQLLDKEALDESL